MDRGQCNGHGGGYCTCCLICGVILIFYYIKQWLVVFGHHLVLVEIVSRKSNLLVYFRDTVLTHIST